MVVNQGIRLVSGSGLPGFVLILRPDEAITKGHTLRMDQPVFLSPMGFRWDKNNLDKLWRVALKEAGTRKIRFHDLRHTLRLN